MRKLQQILHSNLGTTLYVNSRIFADVISYIFPLLWRIEGIMLDTNRLQTFKELVELTNW